MSTDGPEVLSQGQPSASPAPSARGRFWLLLKVGVTAALITWLVRSDRLNFEALGVLWTAPVVAFCALMNFAFGVIVCGGMRWLVLLRALGLDLSVKRALGLHWLAVFFNTFVPGNVGGDLMKNHAVVERDPGRLVVVALLERVLGLTALLWTAIPAVALSGPSLAAHPGGDELMVVVLIFFCGSVIGLVAARWFLSRLPRGGNAETANEDWVGRLGRFVQQHLRSATDTLRVLATSPMAIVKVLGWSLLMHAFAVFNFWMIARHLNNPTVTLSQMALAYPLGMLSIALPISISGLGVGHLFFNELFKILGLVGGADVFNVAMIAALLLGGTGAIPYWFMKLGRR